MEKLKGYEKKYLRGLAHGIKPSVFIGQQGLTPTVAEAVEEALEKHELIKVRFIDFKEKEQKTEIAEALETSLECSLAGMIGHVAILYRPQRDPEKRTIQIPTR